MPKSTNDSVQQVPLEIIESNPYQMRDGEDPEHIAHLADSIARDGLLQLPLARPTGTGDRVQLAFGHSRLAAYKQLQERSRNGEIVTGGDLTNLALYDRMPVMVRELTDEQMFVFGAQENLARKNLTPVEEGKLMVIYREKFGKTSAQIGELFGLSESAVRNKMRLVELPASAQTSLAEGKITENAARRVLSLQAVMRPEAVEKMVEHISTTEYSKPEQVDNSIRYALLEQKESVQLYGTYDSDKEQAMGLFPLDWIPPEVLPAPTIGQFKRFFQLEQESVTIKYPYPLTVDEKDRTYGIKEVIENLIYLKYATNEDWQQKELGRRLAEKAPAVMEAIAHLSNPPACKKCPFFVSIRNEGICGRKICFERKRDAWVKLELARVSTETGIAIYDPEKDGKIIELHEYSGNIPFQKMWDAKSPDLRLVGKVEKWGKHYLTGSKCAQLGSLSKESINRVTKNSNGKKFQEERARLEEEERERQRKNGEIITVLLDAIGPEFGHYIYGTLNLGTLKVLCRTNRWEVKDETTANECRTALGRAFVGSLIGWNIRSQGPTAVADYISGAAVEMGMSLKLDPKAMVQELQEGHTAHP